MSEPRGVMEHISIGAKVEILTPDPDVILGRISGVMLRGEGTTYEITWWDNRTRCFAFFEPWEFRLAQEDEGD